MNFVNSSTPKLAGIIQSNYIPWKGYFDFIACCDEFVLLDEVQYTRRDWRNRNKIKTKDGLAWLTIPVEVKGKYEQRIDETRISEPNWHLEHRRSLQHAYGKAPCFAEVWPYVESLYDAVAGELLLTRINEHFIRSLASYLGIATPIHRSTEFSAGPGKNERLIEICEELGATIYLSGPAAKAYMNESLWNARGLSVRFKSYADYPEYSQLYPPFEHGVTVLDLLFNLGKKAGEYYRSPQRFEPSHE